MPTPPAVVYWCCSSKNGMLRSGISGRVFYISRHAPWRGCRYSPTSIIISQISPLLGSKQNGTVYNVPGFKEEERGKGAGDRGTGDNCASVDEEWKCAWNQEILQAGDLLPLCGLSSLPHGPRPLPRQSSPCNPAPCSVLHHSPRPTTPQAAQGHYRQQQADPRDANALLRWRPWSRPQRRHAAAEVRRQHQPPVPRARPLLQRGKAVVISRQLPRRASQPRTPHVRRNFILKAPLGALSATAAAPLKV